VCAVLQSSDNLIEHAERLYGIREVAGLFGVDISTIRRWEQAGYLRSVRIGMRGHRRYHVADIEALLDSRAAPEQAEA
jgi:excisionase family DNA binding protein